MKMILFKNVLAFSFMSNTFVLGVRNVKAAPLSVKDQEEKAKRSEFVQGLLLSTILDDILWKASILASLLVGCQIN